MGNSATKEQRTPPPYQRPPWEGRSSATSPTSPNGPYSPDGPQVIYSSRHGRGSRSELSSILGISSGHERGEQQEVRRETKVEREARRLERERVNREKERERSMRGESVDGGYLVTQGVYTGIEDYNKPVVRQLMIERRVAPFWRGLNDHSDSWTEHQLVTAARGLPIPAADEAPPSPQNLTPAGEAQGGGHSSSSLAVPAPNKTQPSEQSSSLLPSQGGSSLPHPGPGSSGSALLRGRAKTLASLTTSKNQSQTDMQPREIQLPSDPYVNGQPIEAYLYKDASECPICFLYYPPYLNRTRCCDQPICSECFVQIKRPDPHPPEHQDPSQPQAQEAAAEDPESLVSEPAACPYCVQPEFGVTFDPLPFRRGLAYANQEQPSKDSRSTPLNSSQNSSIASLPQSGQTSPQNTAQTSARKRGISISVSAPQVISTDRVRPDWATKLASARAHAARRSAAATALHTAAYLMGGREAGQRGFRRGLLRRGGSGSDSPNANLAMLGLTGRYDPREGPSGESAQSQQPDEQGQPSPSMHGPPRQSSRRNRVEDLEEMMMMEAIRLSLASEEERRKREEKDAKKDAKKRQKEERKAEKAARKGIPFGSGTASANQSSNTLGATSGGEGRVSPPSHAESSKGKGVARNSADGPSDDVGDGKSDAQIHLERSRAQLSSDPASSSHKPSHLRNLSNASSSSNSLTEQSLISPGQASTGGGLSPGLSSTGGLSPGLSPGLSASGREEGSDISAVGTPTGAAGGAGLEPMFNFRSLSEMVRGEEKGEGFVEHDEGVTETSAQDGETRQAGQEEVVSPLAQGLKKVDGEENEDEERGENGATREETSGLEGSVATVKPADGAAWE